MSQQFLGLRTAIYLVNDLNKAKDWYSRAFDAIPYFDQPFYVGFNIGGYELGLQPLKDKDTPLKSGGVEAYWGVEDVEEVYNRLLSLGATPHSAPSNVGGPIMVAMVKDPWENIIGIIYNPLFGKEN